MMTRMTLRPIVRTVCLFILLGLLAGCALLRSPDSRYVQEGDRLLNEGRSAEALLSYRQALQANPRSLPALQKLAQLYTDQGRKRQAARLLQRAQNIQQGNSAVSDALNALNVAPAMESSLAQPAWQTFVADSAPTGLAADAQMVVTALEDGTVAALDVKDGALLWKVHLPAGATAVPLLDRDNLWVGAQDGKLYALSAQNGETRWIFTTRAPIYAAPALSDGVLYLASGDSTLYALNSADGSLRWQYQAGSTLHATPTLNGGVIYFGGNDGKLNALDAASGAPYWKDGIFTQGPVESQATLFNGRVFTGSGDGRIYALDAGSGGEYWRYSTTDEIYARPQLLDDGLLIASAGGTLALLDPQSGQPRWETSTAGPVTATPAVTESTVFLTVSGDAHLYGFKRASGELAGQLDTGDWISGAPLISGTNLLLAGKDGTVLAYSVGK